MDIKLNTDTFLFDISDIEQNFEPGIERKHLFGEVTTPFSLIKEMLLLIPDEYFQNPELRWLDPAGGYGYFSMILYNLLMDGLREKIKSPKTRSKHILEKMIFICEMNSHHIPYLENIFNSNNIFCNDFLSTSLSQWREKINKNLSKNKEISEFTGFDFIIGNPPYNCGGLKKTPTNTKQNKKMDGKTIWIDFVKHSMSLLREKGQLCMITPAIWMKPDKAGVYYYMLSHKIHAIRCFTNTETNKIFKRQAQTPSCYFLLENKNIHLNNNENDGNEIGNFSLSLYDDEQKGYVEYKNKLGTAIPLKNVGIITKVKEFMEKHKLQPLKVYKTNMPGKDNKLSFSESEEYCYKNIRTCTLLIEKHSDGKQNKTKKPEYIEQYSTKSCAFNGEKKIILAHKMYGHPMYDKEGIYGICNRDNYVILESDYSKREMGLFMELLNTEIVQNIYDTTRYRMKYLERYAFEFIPAIKTKKQLKEWKQLL